MARTPASAPAPLTDVDEVGALADRARAAGRVALDVEFMWERTYAPIPCLAQLAVGQEVALVDPIGGAPLEPVAALLEDPGVEVVMHAPSADLTLFALAFGTRPENLVDTQVTAGFVGLGAGQSLGTLVDRVLRVRLTKTEGYTDWSRRPLSAAQLAYAASDVRHLMPLADELARRVAALGREEWVADELARRYGPDARMAPEPDEAWRRVKGQGRLSPADRAVLRRAAAWREREARRRDRPSQWVMPDRTLVEIARRRPATVDAILSERGVPDRMRPDDVAGLLAAVAAGAADAPISLPPPPPPGVQARMEVLGPLGQVLVAARAGAQELAPSLVATRDEVEGFLAAAIDGGADEHALGRGWRRALVGEALIALAEGRISLAPRPEPPFLDEIPQAG